MTSAIRALIRPVDTESRPFPRLWWMVVLLPAVTGAVPTVSSCVLLGLVSRWATDSPIQRVWAVISGGDGAHRLHQLDHGISGELTAGSGRGYAVPSAHRNTSPVGRRLAVRARGQRSVPSSQRSRASVAEACYVGHRPLEAGRGAAIYYSL